MEEKIKQVKEIPEEKGYTGLTVSRKPVSYTPNKLLNAINAPEENRPVFMLTPMTIEQRNMVDGDTARVKSKVGLWARDNGIKISDFSDMYQKDEKGELINDENGMPVMKEGRSVEAYIAYTSMFDFFADNELKSEIVRKNIKGVKAGIDKRLKFKKDEEGYLHKEEFESYHPKLISELFDKINSISNPDSALTLGL